MRKDECPSCGKEKDENYSLCMACNIKNKEVNAGMKIADALEKMNWNLGFICELYKRKDPKLAKEIELEWKKKEKKKGD